jgi:hypothetical protein
MIKFAFIGIRLLFSLSVMFFREMLRGKRGMAFTPTPLRGSCDFLILTGMYFSFQDHGKLLVPCLDHVVNFFNGDDLTEQMKLMLAESLDAKARLAGSRRNTMCKEGNI